MPGKDYFLNLYHADASTFVQAPPKRVDWRWDKASKLLRLGPPVARYELEQDQDPAVVAAYEYRKMCDSGLDAYSEYRATSAAHDVYANREGYRRIIEGLLLCDPEHVSYADIAKVIHVDVATIDAYASLFFDVRPYRENWGWLYEQFFTSTVYEQISSRDSLGMARRIAALFGHEVFTNFYNCQAQWSDKIRQSLGERLYEVYYKQALFMALSRGSSSDRDVKLVEIVCNAVRDEAQNRSSEDVVGQGVMSFLQSVSLQVADPSLTTNLELPAREPRAHEIMALAHKQVEA